MKKLGIIAVVVLVVFACSKNNANTMYVKGNIKGLKKGTLYLEKQIDSVFVAVDSVHVNGSSEFLLTDIVNSPEVYYLSLSNSSKKIPFFGEKDSISIRASLEKMEWKAEIDGSKNQELLDQYYGIKKRFNGEDLDLLKKEFEAKKIGNQDSITQVVTKRKRLQRNAYLYTTNFAINNADFEVAPYVALTELYNANIKLLDTINKSLTPKIKESKYGKQLDKFVKEIKTEEHN